MTIKRNTYDPGYDPPVGYVGPELVENSSQQRERDVEIKGIEISGEILDKVGIRKMSPKDEKETLKLLELIGITKMVLNGDKPEQR